MAFLDEFGKKAQAYAGVAVDKAKDLAVTAFLRTSVFR